MAIESVDIRILDHVRLDLVAQLPPRELSRVLQGTELSADPRTGRVYPSEDPQQTIDLQRLLEITEGIRAADGDGDGELTLKEVEEVLGKNKVKSPPEMAAANLKYTKELCADFFNPLARNTQNLRHRIDFIPLLEGLHTYNDTLYQTERRLARGPSSILKGLLNTVHYLASGLGMIHDLYDNFFGKASIPVLDEDLEDNEAPHHLGDQIYLARGYKKFQDRKAAIHQLNTVIRRGITQQKSWALSGDIKGALKELDEDSLAILEEELALEKLWALAKTVDRNDYRKKAFAFAQAERMGFLTLGGGNSSERHWLNWTGIRNNYPFARGLLRSLIPPEEVFAKRPESYPYADAARRVFDEMDGSGGTSANILSVLISHVQCNMSIDPTCERTQLRNWSDEDAEAGVVRAANAGLLFFGYKGLLEGSRLGGYQGWQGMKQALRKENGGRWYRPIRSWQVARKKEIERLSKDFEKVLVEKTKLAETRATLMDDLKDGRIDWDEYYKAEGSFAAEHSLIEQKWKAQIPKMGRITRENFHPFEHGLMKYRKEAAQAVAKRRRTGGKSPEKAMGFKNPSFTGTLAKVPTWAKNGTLGLAVFMTDLKYRPDYELETAGIMIPRNLDLSPWPDSSL